MPACSVVAPAPRVARVGCLESSRCLSSRSLAPRAFAPRRAAVVRRSAAHTGAMAAAGVAVKEVATTKIDGQKTGTSGLRKKAKEFSSGSYLANWVQSLFNALPKEQRVRKGFVGSAPASLLRRLREPPRHRNRGARTVCSSLVGAGGARASHAAARRIGRGYPVEHNRSRCCAMLAHAPAADARARA